MGFLSFWFGIVRALYKSMNGDAQKGESKMTKSTKKLALATKYISAQVAYRRKAAERSAAIEAGLYGVVDDIVEMDTVISLGYEFRAMCNPGSPFYIKG